MRISLLILSWKVWRRLCVFLKKLPVLHAFLIFFAEFFVFWALDTNEHIVYVSFPIRAKNCVTILRFEDWHVPYTVF